MDTLNLCSLPLEVRELIYSHFFEVIAADPVCEKTTFINVRSRYSGGVGQNHARHTWTTTDASLTARKASANSLLLLSRQIYREALSVYWRRRSLSFVVESLEWPFRAYYHIQERIAAICCIRNYLLRLATTQPAAIASLENITIRVFGFDHLDIAEIYDIMYETQKLLSNWRRNIPILPVWLNLSEDFELRLRENRPNVSIGATPRMGASTMIQFYLPVHDTVRWKAEVGRQMRAARNSFNKLAEDYDKEWCTWCFDLLEWSLMNFETENQGCLLQRGCHCEKHIGRTQLAREIGQLHSLPLPEVSPTSRKLIKSFR